MSTRTRFSCSRSSVRLIGKLTRRVNRTSDARQTRCQSCVVEHRPAHSALRIDHDEFETIRCDPAIGESSVASDPIRMNLPIERTWIARDELSSSGIVLQGSLRLQRWGKEQDQTERATSLMRCIYPDCHFPCSTIVPGAIRHCTNRRRSGKFSRCGLVKPVAPGDLRSQLGRTG